MTGGVPAEPLLFESSRHGRRASTMPASGISRSGARARLPAALSSGRAPELPELVVGPGGAVEARPDLLRILALGVDGLDHVFAANVAKRQPLREAMSQRLAA